MFVFQLLSAAQVPGGHCDQTDAVVAALQLDSQLLQVVCTAAHSTWPLPAVVDCTMFPSAAHVSKTTLPTLPPADILSAAALRLHQQTPLTANFGGEEKAKLIQPRGRTPPRCCCASLTKQSQHLSLTAFCARTCGRCIMGDCGQKLHGSISC
jgi:hypothetical protein